MTEEYIKLTDIKKVIEIGTTPKPDADKTSQIIMNWLRKCIMTTIEACPRYSTPAEVEKRPRGAWEKYSSFTEGGKLVNITYKCSICGRKIAYIVPSNKPFTFEMFLKEYPFCNCGADMREEKQDPPIYASWDSADDDTTFCCCSNCGHLEKNNLKGTCPGCGAAMY